MRKIYKVLALTLLLSLLPSVSLTAQQAGQIKSMKLLTADTGWAATDKKLFWTTDNGAHWKDITPKSKPDRTLASIFFLDPSRGWVLLAHPGIENPNSGTNDTYFELASTGDAGETWSVKQLLIPDPDPSRGLSGGTWLDFVDPLHGWVLVRMNGNTAMNFGVMRATDDGGTTWKTLGVPAAGPIHFITPLDGWLHGGSNAEAGPGLYVTRDGGSDWAPVTISAPSQFGPKIYPDYQLPDFAGKDSGGMLVTFSQPNDESPRLALFTTKDSGRTWALQGSVEERGTAWRAAYAGSEWLAVGCPGHELALLRSTEKGVAQSGAAKNSSEAVCSRAGAGIHQISFLEGNRGWILLEGGGLLSTSDGQIWSLISPPGINNPRALLGEGFQAPSKTSIASGTSPQSYLNPSSSVISTHLGFDRFPVIPKTSDMQSWMNSSPFYDVGIYLPGSQNKSNDPNLTSAWISAVQGQQGWGIIPIWFGVQSACACYVNKTKQCVPFTYQISSNTTQATAQGISEAKAAVSSAQTLGLNPTVIYKDIEHYTPDGSTCSLPVQNFLGGWDQQMQTVGKAGVYGNPDAASQDFAKASPIPDDAWIAEYPATGKPPKLTIWALGALTDSSNWTNNQRIHQVQQNLAEVWGGTVSYNTDPDIEDATVVNANNGVKTYSYNYNSIDCTNLGAKQTWAYGVNGISSTGWISSAVQIPTIVGTYHDANNNEHGFKYLNGTCTSIDYPGSPDTYALGTNNQGQIVGGWCDTGGFCHGFLLSASGTYSQIDYPGSTFTEADGINDAGQIVGAYHNSTGGNQGFLKYVGQFYSIDYPGATTTSAYGINGDANIAGTFGFPNGAFVEYTTPPSWSGSFTSFSYAGASETNGFSIDNDNDLLGSYLDANSSSHGFLLSNGVLLTTFQYPGAISTAAQSVNDFGQIVGWYEDSSLNYHGFLATPQ